MCCAVVNFVKELTELGISGTNCNLKILMKRQQWSNLASFPGLRLTARAATIFPRTPTHVSGEFIDTQYLPLVVEIG